MTHNRQGADAGGQGVSQVGEAGQWWCLEVYGGTPRTVQGTQGPEEPMAAGSQAQRQGRKEGGTLALGT